MSSSLPAGLHLLVRRLAAGVLAERNTRWGQVRIADVLEVDARRRPGDHRQPLAHNTPGVLMSVPPPPILVYLFPSSAQIIGRISPDWFGDGRPYRELVQRARRAIWNAQCDQRSPCWAKRVDVPGQEVGGRRRQRPRGKRSSVNHRPSLGQAPKVSGACQESVNDRVVARTPTGFEVSA